MYTISGQDGRILLRKLVLLEPLVVQIKVLDAVSQKSKCDGTEIEINFENSSFKGQVRSSFQKPLEPLSAFSQVVSSAYAAQEPNSDTILLTTSTVSITFGNFQYFFYE